MPSPATVLLIHFAATWFMTGLIWFVQVVHYPQFANVGPDAFARYHGLHTTLTTRVVGPPMLVELVTAVALLAYRPPGVSLRVVVVGLALLAIVWASTALLQVPMHNKLARGWTPRSPGRSARRTGSAPSRGRCGRFSSRTPSRR